jgi:N-methylhydantoinase A
LAAVELPGVPVSLSSRILPEIREYERTLTTVANGYVRPVVERYLTSLEAALADRGMTGSLHVLRSDGGLAGVEAAAQAPVTMLMSGPTMCVTTA